MGLASMLVSIERARGGRRGGGHRWVTGQSGTIFMIVIYPTRVSAQDAAQSTPAKRRLFVAAKRSRPQRATAGSWFVRARQESSKGSETSGIWLVSCSIPMRHRQDIILFIMSKLERHAVVRRYRVSNRGTISIMAAKTSERERGWRGAARGRLRDRVEARPRGMLRDLPSAPHRCSRECRSGTAPRSGTFQRVEELNNIPTMLANGCSSVEGAAGQQPCWFGVSRPVLPSACRAKRAKLLRPCSANGDFCCASPMPSPCCPD